MSPFGRASGDQIDRLNRTVKVMIWAIAISTPISLISNVQSYYDRNWRIHPEQARSAEERRRLKARVDRMEERFGAMLRWMSLIHDKVGGPVPPDVPRSGDSS